jgi:signal transduction histidine kinase
MRSDSPTIDRSDVNKFFDYGDEIRRLRNSFLTEVRRTLEVDTSLKPLAVKRRKTVLLCFICIEILIGLASFILFMRWISLRLNVVDANTRRFASRTPLLPAVRGGDEVADLDKSFRSMASQLEEADQRKQEYVLMVTHDLRTPLNSVAGCVEMLSSGTCGELSEFGEQTVTRAEGQLKKVLAMINDWLDVEKLQSGMSAPSRQTISLTRLSNDAVSGMKSLLDKSGIEVVVDGTDMDMYADPEMVGRVLANLLGNALKFAPEKSKITIAASPEQNGVRVAVSDQGRGIPAHFKDQIFQRFVQVERSDATKKGGSGLGLAICKAIVENHQGRIGVDSEEGKGSTFWFWLPNEA